MVQTNNTDKLKGLLEEHGSPAMSVLTEALKEVNEERNEQKKEKAKGLIRQCLDLENQMVTAERTFNSQKKKFDKSLGKLLKQVSAFNRGHVHVEEEEEGDNEGDEGNENE